MGVPFDHITTLDQDLSKTAVSQLQRKIVWKYLNDVLPELKGYDILELSVGAAEDAELFGDDGFNILATDVGSETAKVTSAKATTFSMSHDITSKYLDVDAFDETVFEKKFDLVFSNFGGVNRMNPQSFRKLLRSLPRILKPGGRFVAVVMPKLCAWEIAFYFCKLQFKNAFQRFTHEPVFVGPDSSKVKTWFYNPSQILDWSFKTRLIAFRSVAFSLPPAGLERSLNFKDRTLKRMIGFDNRLSKWKLISSVSDHYIVDLKIT